MCLVVLSLLLLAVVLGFSSCVDFWGESLVCWARRSTEQLPRFPSWHISCQEHHGYNRGTCVVQPWCNRGTLWAQLWHNCGTGVVQPGVQPRHMWTHHGTTGTLRAHRGTPGSSVKLDSVIQSYDLDQPKGKCDRSQYASRGFQNISNQPPHALFHDF